MIRLLSKKFSEVKDDLFIERVVLGHNPELDARVLYDFSLKDLKKKVSPETWSKITAHDPLFRHPELEKICDLGDLLPHFHKTIPPSLSRPAFMLNERQQAAKALSLQYIKEEPELLARRKKELEKFQVFTTDGYEVHAGIMIVRDPIWLIADDKDVDWFKVKNKTYIEHGKYPNLKTKDFLYKPDRPNFDIERELRLKDIERMIKRKEDLKYDPIPGSIHYLEADPHQKDPRMNDYAGGHRVWLLVKDKNTNKWVFPTTKVFGKQTFTLMRKKLLEVNLGKNLDVNLFNSWPVMVDRIEYEKPYIIARPRYIAEDVYDLYIRRLKIIFPKASENDLVKYVARKYDLNPITEPLEKEVKGIKTFYFRAVYNKGVFDLSDNRYYSDWAWVPKVELNKYLEEERYTKFKKVMVSR